MVPSSGESAQVYSLGLKVKMVAPIKEMHELRLRRSETNRHSLASEVSAMPGQEAPKKVERKRSAVMVSSQREVALPSLTGISPKNTEGMRTDRRRMHSPPSYSIKIIPAELPCAVSPPSQWKAGEKKGPGRHVLNTVRALEVAAHLPRPSEALLLAHRILLPPPRRPQTLVFDLEETLAHICEHKSDAQVLVKGALFGFNVRPSAQRALSTLHKHWEIIIFASSERARADLVLDYLDPGRALIDYRLYRDHALKIQDTLVKDLRLLAGRDPRRTVIVDNSVTAFAFQLDNGIPIKAWHNNPADHAMSRLQEFAVELVKEKDMRERLKRTFDLTHFREDFARTFPELALAK